MQDLSLYIAHDCLTICGVETSEVIGRKCVALGTECRDRRKGQNGWQGRNAGREPL